MFALNILNAMKSKFGKNLLSVLIGVGIASLFRRSCDNGSCMEFKGPSFDKISKTIYRYNNKCYKFNENNVSCNNYKKQIEFA